MHNGILLSHKKNEILPFSETLMDVKIFIMSKVTQRNRKLHITYMWNLKNNTNGEGTG